MKSVGTSRIRLFLASLKPTYYVLALVGLCIERLIWFQSDRALIGGDVLPSLSPLAYLARMFYSWDEINLGNLNDLQPRMVFPQHLFEAFGQVAGIGLANSEKILVVLMFMTAAISVYYLWPLVFSTLNWRRPAFIAAVAYIFNPFLIGDGINSSVGALPFYAFVPLSLLFCLKGLRNRDMRWAIALSLLSPLVLSDFPTLHTSYFVAFSLLTFSFLYALSTHRIRFTAYFLSSALALSILINLWWLLPISQNVNSYANTLSSVPVAIGVNGNSTILEVLRFLGKWSFYASYQGRPYIPYSTYYFNNLAILILSFIPSILGFSALIFRPRDKAVAGVAIIGIISLFLAKGSNPPGGFLFTTLLDLISPFKTFRESWYLVQLAVIPASLLVGMTIASIISIGGSVFSHLKFIRTKSHVRLIAKYVVALGFIFLIMVPGWPLITGNVAALPFNAGLHGVSVPTYYNDLIAWDNNQLQVQGDFKILELPMRGAYADYTWGYQGGNLLGRSMPNLISGAGTEYSSSSGSQRIVNLAYEAFYSNSSSFATILSSIGVRYVILETDFNTTFYGLPSIGQHLQLLQKGNGLTFLESFGKIMVYKNLTPSSSIYVPASLTYISATIDSPQGVVWEDDNFSSGWTTEKWGTAISQIQVNNTGLSMTLQATGAYTASSALRTVSPNQTSAKYLLTRFRTDAHTSMAIELVSRNGSYYPVPLNSPTPGHSSSIQWYTLAYQLAPNVTLTGVRVWITNYHDTPFSSQLQLWLSYIRFANNIGSDSDVMQILSNSSLTSPSSFILQSDYSNLISTLTSTPYIKSATILSTDREDPTSIEVRANATGPSILVFGEAFSPQWVAYANNKLVSNHFTIDGFANAWLLNETGLVTIHLSFSTQNYVFYGSIVSIFTIIAALLLLIFRKFQFKKAIDPIAQGPQRSRE